MTESVLIAGSGGQGVLTLGLFFARAAIREGKKVTWVPAYGAEKRGGFSYCSVVISDDEIFSPLASYPDALLLFDQRAAESYKNSATDRTLVVENTTLIMTDPVAKGKKILIPAFDIANKLKFSRAANIVIAGAYFAASGIIPVKTAEDVMAEMLKGRASEAFEKNLQAFNEGYEYVKGTGKGNK